MTISAKIIADSLSPAGVRLTTMQLRYPKFIHGEFMTHRVFSRNASSSRAIPVERLIDDVIDDPVYPSHWGANQKGMQADEECDDPVYATGYKTGEIETLGRKELWDIARRNAIDAAEGFTEAGYHKQIVNRLLEPFCHINVVVTSTEWSNFFALRCHLGAQPEMRLLAEAMKKAYDDHAPPMVYMGQWHLPYVEQQGITPELGIKLSVARCARVSYLTQEGKEPSVADDLLLYDRLVGAVPLHASPAEHQATPDQWLKDAVPYGRWAKPGDHGNLRGWIQYRKTLPGENQ